MYQLQLAAQGRRDRSRSVRSGVLPAPDRVLDVGLRESKAGRRACARESASPPSALFGAFLFLLKTYTPNCLCLAPNTGARQSGDRGDFSPRLGYIGVLPGQFFANPLRYLPLRSEQRLRIFTLFRLGQSAQVCSSSRRLGYAQDIPARSWVLSSLTAPCFWYRIPRSAVLRRAPLRC